MNTVTGQDFEDDNANLESGEIVPKMRDSGPIPPYAPSASGVIEQCPELFVRD
jgi:hypothetical protein